MITSSDRLDMPTLLLLLGTILLLAAGQILFKFAAAGVQFENPRTLLSLPLLAALALYGVATLMWLLVLTRLPLSFAFPFYGLTFLLVPILAAVFLGETLRIQTLVGGLVIMVGVVICARSSG